MTKGIARRTNLSIASVGILTFVGILVETSMNVTFPALMKIFAEPLGTVQWLTTGYLLMVTLVMGTTAFLLKRFKKRNLFLFSIGISTLGIICCLTAPNFWVLMLGRLFQASGTGISTPLMFSIIFSEIPREHWGTYSGIAAMLISLAPALGPTYGGIMNHYFSWRTIFSFALLLVLVSLLIGILNIRDNEKQQHNKFDTWGFLTLSFFLILLEFGIQQLSKNYLYAITLLFLGIISLVLFIRHEKNSTDSQQLINPLVFRNKYLMFRLFNYFVLQLINISMSFIIPVFSENILQANSLIAGLVLLPGSLLGSLTAPLAGRWYDQVGAKKPLLTSNCLIIAGMLLFTLFINDLNIWLIGLFFIVTRLGFNAGFGNTMSDASKAVPLTQKADQNSLFSMSQQYAGSIGTAIMAAIISLQGTGINNTKNSILSGTQLGFGLLLIFGIAALICTLTLSKKDQQNKFNK